MTRHRLFLLVTAIALFCLFERHASADATWNGNAGADDRWSTPGNWVGSGAPGNPESGTVYFGDDDLGNVNGMDADWSVDALEVTGNSVTQTHTTDLSNNTLVVQSLLRVGRNTANSKGVIQNGTLQLGTDSQAANVYLGLNDSSSVDSHQTNHSLTVNGTLNASNLNALIVARTQNRDYWAGATLDLSSATIIGPSGPNVLNIGSGLYVGYGSYNRYTAYGDLRLPASLRSLTVAGSLICGEGMVYSPKTYSEGSIDFGVGSALTNLTILGSLDMANEGAVRGEFVNFPSAAAITISQSGSPQNLFMARNTAGQWDSDFVSPYSELITTNRFTAYLERLYVAQGGNHVHGSATGLLDVAGATVQIGDTPNKIKGLSQFVVGIGKHAYGTVRIPPQVTELSVGLFVLGAGGGALVPVGANTYYPAFATLDIGSNSQLQAFTVTNGFYMAAEQANG